MIYTIGTVVTGHFHNYVHTYDWLCHLATFIKDDDIKGVFSEEESTLQS